MSANLKDLCLLAIYLITCKVIVSNSRTSTLWKLNADETKIIEASPFHQVVSVPNSPKDARSYTENDPVFNIISTTSHDGEQWMKFGFELYCTGCNMNGRWSDRQEFGTNSSEFGMKTAQENDDDILDCGKPVNFTIYDNLVGILNRDKHPLVPDQDAISFFVKNRKLGRADHDIDALERRLKKARRDKPKSLQLYHQIGNFWRIKGDAQKSIECFRRVLYSNPTNSDVLLNLAKVLYALQYLDDAIYLTRRSLEVHPPERGAWQQYFTLGQIFKAYGHYQEASMHLRHSLDLRPGYEPAQNALKEIEIMPADSIHVYTLVIIVCLVLGVLLVILSSVDTVTEECSSFEVTRTQRFNKAMAMKTLRGISLKGTRVKRI